MARRRTLVGLLTVVTVLATAGGCRLKDQRQPSLTGPSELGLSLTTTVVPDHLTRDGSSQAVITVTARGETGQPKANVSVLLNVLCDTASGGRLPIDVGSLSSGRLTTGQDGRATAVFTAPTEADFIVSHCGVTTINTANVYVDLTPISDNVQNTIDREVQFVLVPDPQAPVASFSYSPASPAPGDEIVFDASTSHAAPGRKLVAYFWQFGTDRTGSGMTVSKIYGTAATYYVTLVVTDDLGQKGQIVQAVTVQ
jgi:hypothetical protein